MFTISLIPAFKDNYIWLLTQGQHAAVVDPGEAAPVIARLEAEGLTLESILITHHHADHQGGVGALAERWQPTVFAPAAESITGCNHPLRGGERIEVLGQTVEVMAVPGHTLGHLAYYAAPALFCGDTLFGAGCGRLFEGAPAQMAASLAMLAALPDETLVYCAHEYTEMNLRFALAVEPESPALQQRVAKVAALRAAGQSSVPATLGEEKATNPFLRCEEAAVVAAGLQHAAVDRSKTAIFTAIRAWRNSF
ncbi:hydroxyacylglutathione hydrolase [Dechloromonas denitrificans]|uniref:Hydroxyacylglutathione hydrolase n=1 Tax=Dechloromonas denitrificans TaxID=281362 RepID=A0A133XP98_9RHOO|nr:hydroxyacylglutathione hydrolase [Dechloromonas denitrificans]KXB32753.1 hydroxyacylglutathione hydrolase [Dechloromonas denitrificans]